MADKSMPHEGHENHLCYLQNIGLLEESYEEYEELVKNADFICADCGRVANKDIYVCVPKKLNK